MQDAVEEVTVDLLPDKNIAEASALIDIDAAPNIPPGHEDVPTPVFPLNAGRVSLDKIPATPLAFFQTPDWQDYLQVTIALTVEAAAAPLF